MAALVANMLSGHKEFVGLKALSLPPGHLVWHLIVGRVMDALRSLGQRALQNQNGGVIYQGNAEFHRLQVHIISNSARMT
jgi:hypothetical protein